MPLFPLQSPPKVRRFIGFDIETYAKDNKHQFLCVSFFGQGVNRTYRDPTEAIEFLMKLNRKAKIVMVATNTQFDLFTMYKTTKYMGEIYPVFRGSRFISAEHIHKKEECLEFLDSMNFLPYSVERLGREFLKLPKMKPPKWMGKRKPKNHQEWSELIKYNKRDAKITFEAMHRLQLLANNLAEHILEVVPHELIPAKLLKRWKTVKGFMLKATAPGSSLDCFQRMFLEEKLPDIPQEYQKKIFDAYYGGRCEVFIRGRVHNKTTYDVNSMYPFVMQFTYPKPHKIKHYLPGDASVLKEEGISLVTVEVPKMHIPPLPYRTEEGRLLFPTGVFQSWQSHNELRAALLHGVKVLKWHESLVFPYVCKPFEHYVRILYHFRLWAKANGQTMLAELAKLLMNALYGRFAMKPSKNRRIYHESQISAAYLERAARMGKNVYQPAPESCWYYIEDHMLHFMKKTVPIWSVYVTAYARMHLHNLLMQSPQEVVYCDTDSLTTNTKLAASDALGGLKIERVVKEGLYLRPKLYSVKTASEEFAKAKGIIPPKKLREKKKLWNWFLQLVKTRKATYTKFATFGMSQRRWRGKIHDYSEIVEIRKKFDLEDTKRQWKLKKVPLHKFECSQPLHLKKKGNFHKNMRQRA